MAHTHITVHSIAHLERLQDICFDYEQSASDDHCVAEAQMYRHAGDWLMYQSRHVGEVVQIPVEHIQALDCVLSVYFSEDN